MSGPSYSSIDSLSIHRAVQAGDLTVIARLARLASGEDEACPRVTLRLNDPEPGYLAEEYPGLGAYILEVDIVDRAHLQAFEQALKEVTCQIQWRRV